MNTLPETKNDHELCRSCFERLSEYIDQELGDSGMNEIKTHLENCICCSSCYSTLKKTVEMCSKFENIPLPPSFSSQLRSLCEKLTGENIRLD